MSLKIQNLSKSFGSTQALKNVSLEIGEGQVLALCGENGAGKSTLLKILSGALKLDAGSVYLGDEVYAPCNPKDARDCGLAMVHQELMLVPDLSVEENILLGLEPHRFGWIQGDKVRGRAQEILRQLGHEHLDTRRAVKTLSSAEQQIVEIARGLVTRPRVLLLDEPTSSLTQEDAKKLHDIVRSLAAQGVAVVYISHFLEECMALADRYVVLRDGESVASGEIRDTSIPEIISHMAGREIRDLYPRRAHALGEVVLEWTGVNTSKVKGVSLKLRRGEILGVAGLMGAGRTELLRAGFGLDCGKPWLSWGRGIGFLSENRKEEGLMLERSLAENLSLSHLKRFAKWGCISDSEERQATRKWMEVLRVKAQSPDQTIGALSGGNQQKIALARLLDHPCEVFLLDEPTRGIDVSSKVLIYDCIQDLAAQGKSVIYASSYIPELLGVCDTIAVMRQGKLSVPKPVDEWTEEEILKAALPQGDAS
jgi:ribose transport system ATP-binding protein